MSKKILVTGGTGFLGAYIIQELIQKSYQVFALRRSSTIPSFLPAAIFDSVTWIEGDILDVTCLDESFAGMDAIIHAAAMVSFHKEDQHQLYKTNVEGTANVVNAAIEHQVPKFIHISSVAALGRVNEGDTVTENKKWVDSKTNTHYAISKFRAEMEVWRGMAEGLNVVVLNPSTILGYGNWDLSSTAIFKNVYNEFPWYTNGINGFVAVEDVAKAAIELLESDIANEKFIINGDNWSFRKLFDTIADGFGKKRPHREATVFLGSIAWRLEALKSFFTRQKPLLTKETAKVAQSATYFDNSKILKALPNFRFTPLESAIEVACKKYLKAL